MKVGAAVSQVQGSPLRMVLGAPVWEQAIQSPERLALSSELSLLLAPQKTRPAQAWSRELCQWGRGRPPRPGGVKLGELEEKCSPSYGALSGQVASA